MNKTGGCTIELLIPFQHLGKEYTAITIKPVMFDHTLRWQAGDFKSAVDLLASLTGEKEATLRMIRYPDIDRVWALMMTMIPDAIGADIREGRIPRKPGEAPPVIEEEMREEERAVPEPDDGARTLLQEAPRAA
jgi:hypothetical protein